MVKYPLAMDNLGEDEKNAAKAVIDSGFYTMGKKVREFEERIADMFGVKDAIMVNSGSSANLLLWATHKELYGLEDDEPISVPSVAWSTTYSPIIELGGSIHLEEVDKWGHSSTASKDVCFNVDLLGKANWACRSRPNDLKYIDGCENFNPEIFKGRDYKAATLSFFYSHHINTLEGGMLLIPSDKQFANIARAKRAHGWTRDLPENNGLYYKTGNPFKDSFSFVTHGYCLRPGEINAAIGLVQLDRWNETKQIYQSNASYFKKKMKELEMECPDWINYHNSIPFALPTMVKDRESFAKFLAEHDIDSRPLLTGLWNRQLAVSHDTSKYTNSARFMTKEELQLDNEGIMFGNYGQDLTKQIDHLGETILKWKEQQNA